MSTAPKVQPRTMTLSWPWDVLVKSQAKLEEAFRAAEQALADNVTSRERLAAFDLETALMESERHEENLANIFVLMFHYALKHAHLELWGKIRLLLQESVYHAEFKKWLMDRDTRSIKAENWELAKWCKELQDRVIALEAKVAP